MHKCLIYYIPVEVASEYSAFILSFVFLIVLGYIQIGFECLLSTV